MSKKNIATIIVGIVILWVCSILAYTLSYTSEPSNTEKQTSALVDPKTRSKNWIAVDAQTGDILGQQNDNKKVPIASLVKILVAYTVLTEIENKHVKLTDTATLSQYGHAISQDIQLTNAPMALNESYTIEELLNIMMTSSANNAAITLSERVAGSEKEFMVLMEKNLAHMGITNYVLKNVTGLDATSIPDTFNDSSGTNLFTSNDLSIMTQKLINQFPDILKITSQPSVVFNHAQINNTNQFITGDSPQPNGWHIRGLKTGTSASAGFGLVTVGTSNVTKNPIIVIVLDAKTDDIRYDDTTLIFDSITG
ncbi:D-alanyl-D-alanine carboxypeptidase family protein [Weissella tructae]|uniref:Serine-type D-Ala-D-Ala carboxypeptidase n=2 Tax=Weissella TaxID=46255 RepID=A0A075TZX6_9LACO|nr:MULTISPECIES: serine hydrolase [Weissella]AIG65453.1 Serine-type D-Ala-D-Ala carboxypeptidase [Weissella tructae]AIM62767.1 Serine-type D-Ala-D-Ala carboxypeptidase [Weissella ceti]AIM64102.1 Serine-type D-Ala-D-Ala carboxypeptidase [Weissella ceti]ELA07087.1 D-alanyl-D-alanine carboxypeptidase [Weissella ceti NC36]QVV91827.1 serine hydrolase [Weissella tructae]